jgi:hypothetical protein
MYKPTVYAVFGVDTQTFYLFIYLFIFTLQT